MDPINLEHLWDNKDNTYPTDGQLRLAIYAGIQSITGREITELEHDALKALMLAWQQGYKSHIQESHSKAHAVVLKEIIKDCKECTTKFKNRHQK